MKLNAAVGWRQLEDRVVVAHVGLGTFYVLEDSAAVVWQLLASGKNAEDIAQHLQASFNTTLAIAKNDVSLFLQEITKADLLAAPEDSLL